MFFAFGRIALNAAFNTSGFSGHIPGSKIDLGAPGNKVRRGATAVAPNS